MQGDIDSKGAPESFDVPELHAAALSNITAYKSDSQQCFAIEARREDARSFTFPTGPLLLYLFNPLPASGLSVVLENLKQSLQESPRTLYVLYHNPEHEHLLEKCSYLKKTDGTHQYSLYVAIPPSS